jgi:hypothetical protein
MMSQRDRAGGEAGSQWEGDNQTLLTDTQKIRQTVRKQAGKQLERVAHGLPDTRGWVIWMRWHRDSRGVQGQVLPSVADIASLDLTKAVCTTRPSISGTANGMRCMRLAISNTLSSCSSSICGGKKSGMPVAAESCNNVTQLYGAAPIDAVICSTVRVEFEVMTRGNDQSDTAPPAQ